MNVIEEVENFYRNFKGEKSLIGSSLNGYPLYLITVQKTKYPIIIAQYSIHAREYITSYLALKQINDFDCYGKKGTVHFLPLMNPDGVFIALNRDDKYKSNARGVDLNVNFDARWGLGKTNIRVNGAENCIGRFPFSEPETKALKDFTLSVQPSLTLSYHSKGEEIYWEFFQDGKRRERDYRIAKAIGRATGYVIKSTPNSCGGYKDWCIESLKIPAFTIEVGNDNLTHPLKKRHLEDIYYKNKDVISAVINAFSERIWI